MTTISRIFVTGGGIPPARTDINCIGKMDKIIPHKRGK